MYISVSVSEVIFVAPVLFYEVFITGIVHAHCQLPVVGQELSVFPAKPPAELTRRIDVLAKTRTAKPVFAVVLYQIAKHPAEVILANILDLNSRTETPVAVIIEHKVTLGSGCFFHAEQTCEEPSSLDRSSPCIVIADMDALQRDIRPLEITSH